MDALLKPFSLQLTFSLFCCVSPEILQALPSGSKVASGEASIVKIDAKTTHIITSDKAIIQYDSFNIEHGEKVKFIQPSANSCTLNRINGKDPSTIFGALEANGKIFLVNPNGVYFGPSAFVNTGAFVVSTLDISNEDFLSERYNFALVKGSEQSKIVQEGHLSAEGSIALLGPHVENNGVIASKTGNVVIGGAQRTTLNFSDHGMLSFTLEGDLEKAIAENKGSIQAANGCVQLKMNVARKAIQEVLNTDGIVQASALVEENGVICLVDKSHIAARHIQVEGHGAQVVVGGSLDVSDSAPRQKGGTIHLLGDHIHLTNADLNASGDQGGGIILIGGDYKGSGPLYRAITTQIDPHSRLYADALMQGDGGKVVVWADDQTFFDGKIFARGGLNGGNGGFVETSGKLGLGIQQGHVNALAPKGRAGDWLLDPLSITVAGAGAGTLIQAANCADVVTALTISAATINAAAANVVLCASTTISQAAGAAINIAAAGVGINYQSGTTTTLGSSTTTNNGAIQFTGAGAAVLLGANTTLNSGGGNISFNGTINSSGSARNLTLNAGAGSISIAGNIGTTLNLATLSMTGNGGISLANIGTSIAPGSAATTLSSSAGAITFNGTNYFASGTASYTSSAGENLNVNAGATTTFRTATSSSSISFNTGTIKLAAGSNLVVNSTTGAINIGSLEATTAETVSLTTTSGPVSLGPVGASSLVGAVSVTTTSGSLTAGAITAASMSRSGAGPSTFNGAITTSGSPGLSVSNTASTTTAFNAPVTVNGSGSVLIAVNSAAALVFAPGINFNVSGTGTFTQTGTTTNFSLGASNITTNGGAISFAARPILTSALCTIDSTNSGAAPAGADINFTATGGLTGTALGANALVVNAGTGGQLSFNGTIGATPLASLTATGNILDVTNNIFTVGPVTLTGNSILTTGNTITRNGIIQINGPVTMLGNTLWESTNFDLLPGADVLFSSTIDGNFDGAIHAGIGNTSYGAVGSIQPVRNWSVEGNIVYQTSTLQLTGSFKGNATTQYQVGGNITTDSITGNATSVQITGPVLLTAPVFVDTTNGGAFAPSNVLFTSTIDGPFSFNVTAGITKTVTFGGAIGSITPLSSLEATGRVIFQQSSAKTVGTITYTGVDNISLGGDVTTDGADITMTGSRVTLLTNVTVDPTNGGAIPAGALVAFSGDISGTFDLAVDGGTGGTISIGGTVGTPSPLNQLTLTADTINLHNVGGLSQGVLGSLLATGTSTINFLGTTYFANNQTYVLPSLAEQFNLLAGSPTTFNTLVGPVQFVGGTVKLASGNDLTLTALNIPQTVEHIEATTCESVSIFTGTGALTIGNLGNTNRIGNLTAMSGSILLDGPINLCGVVQLESIGDISDPLGFTIDSNSPGSMIFNSVAGTVGTQGLPLQVNFPNGTVYAGAPDLASFAGVTTDGTIHRLPSNPPCIVFFNGIKIFDCHIVPPPPPPPSPITPAVIHDFFIPGTYSLFDSLADDWYLFPTFWEFCKIDPYLFECERKKTCL